MRKYPLVGAILLALCVSAPASASFGTVAPARDPALICSGLDATDGLMAGKWETEGEAQGGEFYFSGAEKNLPALESGLHGLGFETRPMRASSGRIAGITAPIDRQWLHTMMPKLCALAKHVGVDYDGWRVVKPVMGTSTH